MWRIISAVLALLTAGVVSFVNLVYRKRRELDGLVRLFSHPALTKQKHIKQATWL